MKKLTAIIAGTALAGMSAFGQGDYNNSFQVEDGTTKVGQNYDTAEDGFDQTYDGVGTKVGESVGTFGSFGGGLHVNWDASGIYIGFEGANTAGGNNFMVFADFDNGGANGVATLAGLGDSDGVGLNAADYDHFDNAENLDFAAGFTPEVGILAGDEWGDQDTFSSFGRAGLSLFGGGNDSGQGLVDLNGSVIGGAFAQIAGADITQFDTNPQNGDDFDGNQDADFVEAFIPAAYLSTIGFTPGAGQQLQIAGIVAGGDAGLGTPLVFFSTTFVGGGASVVPGGGGVNTLDGVNVTLGAIPEPSTFSLLALSLMSFVAFRRKMR